MGSNPILSARLEWKVSENGHFPLFAPRDYPSFPCSLVIMMNQKGMQEHICEILEGGEQAFDLRRHKYHFIRT